MTSQAQVLLARRQVGALAELVGETPDGDRYAPTWFTTGSVAAERTGHRGALGMCDALDLLLAHACGKSWGVRRAAVFLPNQVGKSHHGSVVFPSAVFGRLPRARLLINGFGDDFIRETAPYVQWFMGRPEYQLAYPDVRLGGIGTVDASDNAHRVDVLVRDKGAPVADAWHRSGGFLVCRSFGGAVNGLPVDGAIMSDFYKNWEQALQPTEQRKRRDFYDGVLVRRQQSRRTFTLIAFTPWTSHDVSSYAIDSWDKEGEPYLIIRYPTEAREDRRAELEHWKRSEAQREGLRRFVRAFTSGEGPAVVPVGSPSGCSPELRPYDPRPKGAWLLPLKERDAEFYAQRKRSAPAREWAALDELDPDSQVAETFPRDGWTFYDPREHTSHRKVVIACDPNKRETTDGAFASVGPWGLDPAPPVLGEDGKPAKDEKGRPLAPVHPWVMRRLGEARGRWPYSTLKRELLDMSALWPEAKDMVMEHTANGEALAGDDEFLRELARRGVTLWLAQPNGGFCKVVRRSMGAYAAGASSTGPGWVLEKVGDQAALSGGKDDWWPRMEAPVREGLVQLPRREHGRVTCDWVRDNELGKDEGERQGYVTELARAHRAGVVDRADETAILVAWARTCAPALSSWGYAGNRAAG